MASLTPLGGASPARLYSQSVAVELLNILDELLFWASSAFSIGFPVGTIGQKKDKMTNDVCVSLGPRLQARTS